jgi:hypothetical protein
MAQGAARSRPRGFSNPVLFHTVSGNGAGLHGCAKPAETGYIRLLFRHVPANVPVIDSGPRIRAGQWRIL